jgi:macrolide transport system ATP-binding/permease protein
MRKLRAWMMRFAGLFPGANREQDFTAEIESHIAMDVEEKVRGGMDPVEARREAILQLGGLERTKQAYRERGTVPAMEALIQDLRFALRQLIKNPGFAITAILVLALGIGASVAIFAFVDAALIKPLPYKDPTRLVDATESAGMVGRANLSYPDYVDWKRLNTVFSSFDAYIPTGYMLGTPTGAVPTQALRVTDGFFRTLGVVPALGRDFYAGEDAPNAARTTMLSYETWERRFGGRNDVTGETISLSGIPHTIIGVLPRGFAFAPRGSTEFWTPLHPSGGCDLRRSCHGLKGVARLKDGVTVEAAQANMQSIARQLELQYPGDNRGQSASVLPLSEVIVEEVRPILFLLMGGAWLLLLIACVNVASLVMVRSESRRREIAVRGALGASRSRLIRQFVTEGLVLVAASSAIGLLLAYMAMQILVRHISEEIMSGMPYVRGVGLNSHVLAFAGAIAVIATVVFSLTPILRLPSTEIRDGLAEGGRASAGTVWRRFGSNLVILELAVAVVLLVGAGLLGKSLYRLLRVDLGFQPDHTATIQVALPNVGYEKDEQVIAVTRQMMERLRALPGVKSVAITSVLPVSFNGNTDWIRIVGKPYHGEHNEVNLRDVSSEYFSTVQARLLSGRYFTDTEDSSKALVVIINQTLARKYFPGEDPIGKKIGNNDLNPKSIKEIIGVVEDIRDGALDADLWPAVYYPFNQGPDSYFSIVVRTSQDERNVLPLLSSTIHKIDSGIGTIGEMTMSDKINDSPSAYLHRFTAWLVGGFAGMALLLGVIGLYGVIAYSVSQRTREIGVRMALGAQRSSVYQLILAEAGWLIAVGIGVGLLFSVGAATLMGKLLFGVRAWDASTLAGVAALLAVSALLASYFPAHRAASVNPVDALRSE